MHYFNEDIAKHLNKCRAPAKIFGHELPAWGLPTSPEMRSALGDVGVPGTETPCFTVTGPPFPFMVQLEVYI